MLLKKTTLVMKINPLLLLGIWDLFDLNIKKFFQDLYQISS